MGSLADLDTYIRAEVDLQKDSLLFCVSLVVHRTETEALVQNALRHDL